MGRKENNVMATFLRIEPVLKMRLLEQVDRLGLSQAAIIKMALTRFLEEEEKIQNR